jgi:hypothetical protein
LLFTPEQIRPAGSEGLGPSRSPDTFYWGAPGGDKPPPDTDTS